MLSRGAVGRVPVAGLCSAGSGVAVIIAAPTYRDAVDQIASLGFVINSGQYKRCQLHPVLCFENIL